MLGLLWLYMLHQHGCPWGCQENRFFTWSTLHDLQTHPVDCGSCSNSSFLPGLWGRRYLPLCGFGTGIEYMLLMWEAHHGVFPSCNKGFRYSVVGKKCSLPLWPRSRLIFLKFCAIFFNGSLFTHLQCKPSIFDTKANNFLYLFLYLEKVFSMIVMW